MNIYTIIILAALLLEYILGVVSTFLNLKTLNVPLPREFSDIYDNELYKKSQKYTQVRAKFGLIEDTFSIFILLVFWFLGGFNWFDQTVRSFALEPIIDGIVYIGVLLICPSILSLPFSIYSTFVIEERFGFNRTTPKIFIADRFKELMLAILLGVPLLAGTLVIFTYGGEFAWLYCWILVTLFILFIQYIAPTWLMPLFNKFTPLEDGELKQTILSYARDVNFPLEGIFVMDGSKRSTKANAFFTGFGKHKRIAFFDTLVGKYTVQEMLAILAHEIGHYKKKHIQKGMFLSILHSGFMLYLLSIFINNRLLFDAFFMNDLSVYGSLIFFGLLYSPIEYILGIFLKQISRNHEYSADSFAARTTGHPENLVEALKKLSKDNLSHLTPHRMYVFLNYSHPPILERIRSLRKIENQS